MIEITEDLLRRVLDGDQDAQDEARAMLPEHEPNSLFGRWATHRTHGRVLCVSSFVEEYGQVCVLTPKDNYADGLVKHEWEDVDKLTFDPTDLVTEQDFQDAPEGTIVSQPGRLAHEKRNGWWRGYSFNYSNGEMAGHDPWQVVRWGNGGQQ